MQTQDCVPLPGLSSSATSILLPLLGKPDSATHCNVGSSRIFRTFLCTRRSHGKLLLRLPFRFEFHVPIVSGCRGQPAAASTRQASCDCVARTRKSGPTLPCPPCPTRWQCGLAQQCGVCRLGATAWLVQQCDERNDRHTQGDLADRCVATHPTNRST